MKTLYSVTLKLSDGTRQVVNVAIVGKVRDAMAAAETAHPGSEAESGHPMAPIHLEVA